MPVWVCVVLGGMLGAYLAQRFDLAGNWTRCHRALRHDYQLWALGPGQEQVDSVKRGAAMGCTRCRYILDRMEKRGA